MNQPTIDFATFVQSLASSAVVHLGLMPMPEGEADGVKVEKNLELARQTIDILDMLRDKTKGNLTDEEARLCERLLYDLRMAFVEASRTPQSGT